MAQAAVTAMASTEPAAPGAVVPFARPVRQMPEYRRLSWPEDLAELLRLHQAGLTQVAIAERLGCRQCTVSRWLARLDDTRALAEADLRSQALRMAHNIVENGRVADHLLFCNCWGSCCRTPVMVGCSSSSRARRTPSGRGPRGPSLALQKAPMETGVLRHRVTA